MRFTIIALSSLKIVLYLGAVLMSVFTDVRFYYLLAFPLLVDIVIHVSFGLLLRGLNKKGSIRLIMKRDRVGFPWPYALYLVLFMVFMMIDYEDLKPVPFLFVFILKIADHFFGAPDWAIIEQNDQLIFRGAFPKSTPWSEIKRISIKSEEKAIIKTESFKVKDEFDAKHLQYLVEKAQQQENIKVVFPKENESSL